MNIEEFRDYCLAKPGATEHFPFDENVLVFKAVKMFALTDVRDFESINLKCDPEYAVELREKYPGVIPGYHMNKRLWNTISTDGGVSDKELYQWIDDSYDLIVASLSKKEKVLFERQL